MTGLLLIKACWGTDVQKEREKGRQLRESRWRCGDLRKLNESLRGRNQGFGCGTVSGLGWSREQSSLLPRMQPRDL